jgi:hypothetical protein
VSRMKFIDRAVITEIDALFIRDESVLIDHFISYRKILKKIFKAEI